ncbi:hypothetical protein [Salinibaculum rarum]|uniref:hypothetical protein n=1 Tax=Salinibaculum rarum TaxID=3058903 RepID=UPI002660512C|nr:hypothetical protein [Salinibaculum sp. KK48]
MVLSAVLVNPMGLVVDVIQLVGTYSGVDVSPVVSFYKNVNLAPIMETGERFGAMIQDFIEILADHTEPPQGAPENSTVNSTTDNSTTATPTTTPLQ